MCSRKTITIHVLLLLTTVMGIGACRKAEPGYTPPVLMRKISAGDRIYIPAEGGRTIPVPQHMEDVYTLWAPLAKWEKTDRKIPPIEWKTAKWLPSQEDDEARRYMYRLSRTQRDFTRKVLLRAEQYLPGIQAELQAQGLPPELACIPMVESAFETQAVSRAGAAGLWQLMPQTARRFGLKVSADVDERFHAAKAAKAAAAYLAELYSLFKDWPLAIAAYNCGEGAMKRALERSRSTDFAGLMHFCRRAGASSVLPEETLQYVPRFVAAAAVMSQSKELGLTTNALLNVHDTAKEQKQPVAGKKLSLVGTYDAEPKAVTAPPAKSNRIFP